jgi:hypothetical protein
MVTIAWNPLEFYLLDALPTGNTFNAEYHRVNILAELLPLRRLMGGDSLFMLTTQGPTPPEMPSFLQRKSTSPPRTLTILT